MMKNHYTTNLFVIGYLWQNISSHPWPQLELSTSDMTLKQMHQIKVNTGKTVESGENIIMRLFNRRRDFDKILKYFSILRK